MTSDEIRVEAESRGPKQNANFRVFTCHIRNLEPNPLIETRVGRPAGELGVEQLSTLPHRGRWRVEIESQWTARKRKRLGIFPRVRRIS
jgi:hypothetical protein